MTQTLSTAVIFEHMQALGLSNLETYRDDEFGCWRIRAQGGPVVHIFDNGKVVFSGVMARTLRKALSLAGQRVARCIRAEGDAAGVILLRKNDEGLKKGRQAK